ncbi:MAG: glycosyltransferase family 2 protein [Anaerolineales bacterium]
MENLTGSHQPRVSIGLPVFNAEKYLDQAIDSILEQTFTDFELIISDNCSTDRTREICLAYANKDFRIRYFRNEKNLGAAPNFNRVLELSVGEYFKWAACDDIVAPDFLARCIEILDNDSTIVLCYSRAKIIDEIGEFVDDYNPGPDTSSKKPHERFRKLILHPEYATQQMGVIRSSILRQTVLHGSYPSSDEVLLAQLALFGGFFEIPDRLFYYRIYPQQSTQVMKTQRERVLFFDTSYSGKVVLPKWQYLFACLKVIHDSPIYVYERVNCYLVMMQWLFVPAHFRAMGKDVLIAIRQLLVRPFLYLKQGFVR